jgi:hypothetical protein
MECALMDLVAPTHAYELIPFDPSPARAEVLSRLLREIASKETLFSDFGAPCEEACVTTRNVVEMCETCKTRMRTVAAALSAPNTRAFEVWDEEPELIGVIYFSDLVPSLDAKGHYVFWDSEGLRGKTEVLKEALAIVVREEKLVRLTIEVPSVFVALARHASRHLGFGGSFEARVGGKTLQVEGVKEGSVRWRGRLADLLILGRRFDEEDAESR